MTLRTDSPAGKPAVSVTMPTYNRCDLLREAMDSVRAQTRQDWEMIVVDDGSTDGTRASLDSERDPRVRAVRLPHSGNVARLRNAGIAVARSAWIAFLDSDDLWLPAKLELQLARLERQPACQWSCTGISFIDGRGTSIPQRAGAPYRARSGCVLPHLLAFELTAVLSTLMVHRDLLQLVSGFDEGISFVEDLDLVFRLAERAELCALDEHLTVMREHAGRTINSQRISELHRFKELTFRKAGHAGSSAAVRRICARQCATALAVQARALAQEGRHGPAFAALARALRDTPLVPEVWRAAAVCTRRACTAIISPASE